MGANLLTIERGQPGVRASAGIVTSFLPEDLPSIVSVPGVGMAIPETQLSSLVRFGNQDLMVTAIGVGENFPQAHDWPPQSGVFFSAEHVTRYAQVVVLGTTVAKNLFPAGANPLGQYVLIGNAPFLVIGVLSSKGSTPRGDDQDNSVWLPYTTAGARIFGQRFFQRIIVKVKPGVDMGVVQAGLHTLLINRHGKEDFNIRNMADTIATANETQNTLTYLLAAIAAISLHCRRHWRDEYHAGLGHRADTRNRHPHGDWRAQLRRVVSISYRGSDGLLYRGLGGCRRRHWRRFIYFRDCGLARDFHDCAGSHCLRMRFFDGYHIWLSSGQKSRTTRPHQCAGSGLEPPCVLLVQVEALVSKLTSCDQRSSAP